MPQKCFTNIQSCIKIIADNRFIFIAIFCNMEALMTKGKVATLIIILFILVVVVLPWLLFIFAGVDFASIFNLTSDGALGFWSFGQVPELILGEYRYVSGRVEASHTALTGRFLAFNTGIWLALWLVYTLIRHIIVSKIEDGRIDELSNWTIQSIICLVIGLGLFLPAFIPMGGIIAEFNTYGYATGVVIEEGVLFSNVEHRSLVLFFHSLTLAAVPAQNVFVIGALICFGVGMFFLLGVSSFRQFAVVLLSVIFTFLVAGILVGQIVAGIMVWLGLSAFVTVLLIIGFIVAAAAPAGVFIKTTVSSAQSSAENKRIKLDDGTVLKKKEGFVGDYTDEKTGAEYTNADGNRDWSIGDHMERKK